MIQPSSNPFCSSLVHSCCTCTTGALVGALTRVPIILLFPFGPMSDVALPLFASGALNGATCPLTTSVASYIRNFFLAARSEPETNPIDRLDRDHTITVCIQAVTEPTIWTITNLGIMGAMGVPFPIAGAVASSMSSLTSYIPCFLLITSPRQAINERYGLNLPNPWTDPLEEITQQIHERISPSSPPLLGVPLVPAVPSTPLLR